MRGLYSTGRMLALVLLTISAAGLAFGQTGQLNPAVDTVDWNVNSSLAVTVTNVTNLGGSHVELTFNNQIFDSTTVKTSVVTGNAYPGGAFLQTLLVTSGVWSTLWVDQAFQGTPGGGAGTTTLFTVTMKPIDGTVVTPINVTGTLRDAGNTEIPSTWSNGSWAVNFPVPHVTGISPTTRTADDPAFTLTVTGSNFFPSSVVRVNGISYTTTYVDATTLTAANVAPGTTVGSYPVTVFNHEPAGGTSPEVVNLTVTSGVPTHMVYVQQPTSAVAGVAISPAVTTQLKDAYNNNALNSGVSITMSLSSGTGVLSGTLTQPTDANGLATFNNLSVDLVGPKNLTATGTGVGTVVSNSFSISAAAPASIVFVQQPTDAVAGVSISPAITVQMKDAFGNNATTPAVDITITKTTGNGILTGTTTHTTDLAGIATFNDLRLDTVGTKKLTASGTGVGSVESNSFVISPAAASQIVFIQQPSSPTVAGVAISPPVTVQLRDVYGNNVPQSGISIVMSKSSGTGTLSGTLTQSTDATGLASFADLSVDVVGTGKRLLATSAVGTRESNDFVITQGAASQIVFVQQPLNAVAGASISPAVTIQLRDAYNNNVPTAGISITMSLSSGTGTLGGKKTETTDAAGLATFTNLSVDLVGEKKIKATWTGVDTVESNIFTITAGLATNLVFVSQPSNAVAGVVIAPPVTVRLKDAYGNNVLAAGVAIGISLTTGTGALSGTTTKPTDADGIATFSDLWVNLVGAKVLSASGTGYPTVESNGFTITPSAVDHYSFAAIGAQIAGTPFSISITALDVYGNTATGFAGSVALATSPSGLITPTTSNLFSSGLLTQLVTITATGTGITILANGGSSSNAFDVTASPHVYLKAGQLVSSTNILYPNTTWNATSYEPDDWSFTGSPVLSFYIVPEVGLVFSSFDVTISWAGTDLTYVGATVGNVGGTNFSATLGSNQVTIHNNAASGDNPAIVSGDYLAKVDLTIVKPEYTTVSVPTVTFARSGIGNFTVTPHGGEIKAYLADVASASTDTTGDGEIDFHDLSLWSGSYWSGVPGYGGPNNYKVKYDFGPTMTHSVWAMPAHYVLNVPTVGPDGKINFEDLMVFSMLYGQNSTLPKTSPRSGDAVEVSLGQPLAAVGETRIPVVLGGSVEDVRAMSIQVQGEFGKFLGAETGGLFRNYSTPVAVMGRSEGSKVYVDMAVMGLENPGAGGAGEVVVLRFEGSTKVMLTKVDARDSRNDQISSKLVKGAGDGTPTAYRLDQNYPNPFNPTTTIRYEIPETGPVTIDVFDVLGRQVATLVDEVKEAGYYNVQWNARDYQDRPVASGMYIYRLQAGQFRSLLKMLLLK